MKSALMRFAGQRGTANASNIQAARWKLSNVPMDSAQVQFLGVLARAGPPSTDLSLVAIILEGQKSKCVDRFSQLRAFFLTKSVRSNGKGKIMEAKIHRVVFRSRNI
jgi:hypothetical protein